MAVTTKKKVRKSTMRRAGSGVALAGQVTIDDDRPPLGIRIESSAAGAVRRFAAERAAFVLPLQASVFKCQTRGLEEDTILDASNWLLVPEGQSIRLETRSPTAALLVLSAHPALSSAVESVYAGEVDPLVLQRLLSKPYLAPRTTWVNEIAQRYAFERNVCKKRGTDATTFLEVEILKEWYFVRRGEDEGGARKSHLEGDHPLLVRAQKFIDSNLGKNITIPLLAKEMHASPSAVLRAFQQGMGVAPGTYIRARRLDQALLLLRSGKYAVGEIASRMGYVSFAAFSQAFRVRFGEPPSAFMPNAVAAKSRNRPLSSDRAI